MSNADIIMKMVQDNNGTITTAEVTKAGIYRGSLKHIVDIWMTYQIGCLIDFRWHFR